MTTDKTPADTGTGCCGGCGSSSTERQAEPEIACTLTGDDFEARVATIRDLARRHLRRSRREGLALHLVYDIEARAEVEEIVTKERACCAFLDFSLGCDETDVHLVIAAPPAAAEAADMLFAYFSPELSRETR